MIAGDIDLTENLDFYRDKKPKELPSVVPWIFDQSNKKSNHLNYMDLNTIDDYINIIDQHNQYIINNISINSTTSLTVRYNNFDSWTTFETENELEYNNSYIYYNNNLPDNIIYTTSNSSSNNITSNYYITYNKNKENNNLPFCGKKKKQIKSIVFGHKSKKSRLLPWFNAHDDIKKINRAYYNLTWNDDISILPWDIKKEKMTFSTKRKCPWFDNLSDRIYNDYIKNLYEEVDYSRYLTDMNWIGVR